MAKILVCNSVCDHWTSIDLWTLQQSWRSLAVQQCPHGEKYSIFWDHFHSASSFGTSGQNPKACHNFGSYFVLFFITAANKTNLGRPEDLSHLYDGTSDIAAEQNWGHSFIPMEAGFLGIDSGANYGSNMTKLLFFPSNWRLCNLFQSSSWPVHSRPLCVRWVLCETNAKQHQ